MDENENSTGSESRQTAFHEIMAKTAAGFMEEAGWWWVTGFGDPDAEYQAVREGVGVWDVSPLNKWDFRGPDALEAAQRVHSNDILGMQIGQVRYGAFLDEDGLLVDDGTVFKHADDHLWVCTNGLDHVAYFADAHRRDSTSRSSTSRRTLPHLQVQGPKSREALQPLTDADLSEPPLLPLHPRAGPGRRRARLALADRLLRRARVRAVHATRARGGSLDA